MSQGTCGLEEADIHLMAAFWGMNPAAIGSCLIEREIRIRETAPHLWPLLWGELLARANDGLRDGLARRLLGMLDIQRAEPEVIARMAMNWRREQSGQHWAGHREHAWGWLVPWMENGRPGLVEEVAYLVGGGTLHVAMRQTAGPLPDILATVGPERWVVGNNDVLVPWIHAWVQEAMLGATPLLAEHALDLLMENGCDLDTEDKAGKRAIELIEPDQIILVFTGTGPGQTRRFNHAHILIGMLLDRGACWTDLEHRVSPGAWKVIQAHPLVRKSQLTQILPNHAEDDEGRRAL